MDLLRSLYPHPMVEYIPLHLDVCLEIERPETREPALWAASDEAAARRVLALAGLGDEVLSWLDLRRFADQLLLVASGLRLLDLKYRHTDVICLAERVPDLRQLGWVKVGYLYQDAIQFAAFDGQGRPLAHTWLDVSQLPTALRRLPRETAGSAQATHLGHAGVLTGAWGRGWAPVGYAGSRLVPIARRGSKRPAQSRTGRPAQRS